jgi:hypothetical protein
MPYFPPPGGVRRRELLRRLVINRVSVEGPHVFVLLSNDIDSFFQPLPDDPVPEEVVKTIARRLCLPVEALYVDHLDEDELDD